MIDNEKSLIQSFYESHHEDGQRLKQSFLENRRGLLFAAWIGINKKVLDLGGRDGTLTKHFIEKNNVTLADIDENALEYAKRNYKVETMRVDLNQSLPFKDNSFDVVISVTTLHNLEVDDLIKSLQEIERVARHGSFITVDAYRDEQEKARMDAWNLTAKTIMSVDEWVAFFKEVGYTGDYFWFVP